MKKIISAKRQKFGDRDYCIGEEIPAEVIDPNRIPALLKLGRISTVDVPDEQQKVEEPKPVKATVEVVEKIPSEEPVEETKPEEKPAAKKTSTSKKKASK